jgi:hypothetical protein
VNDDRLLDVGEIIVTHRLVDASNATLFGSIEGYGEVIYKPVAGERPLWDFPLGTLADREVASYKLSERLRLNLVPTTVLRDGPFGVGMVQRWITTDPSIDIVSFGQGADKSLRLMALFDAIVNNTDRKFGHLLLDSSGALFGCDHGVTFHVEDKLRTVLWQFSGLPFDDTEIEVLSRAHGDSDVISKELNEHLTGDEIEALFSRVERLLEDSVFPFPPEGWPSVPWPPV